MTIFLCKWWKNSLDSDRIISLKKYSQVISNANQKEKPNAIFVDVF